MKRHEPTLRELYLEQHGNTPVHRKLLADLQTLENEIRDRKRQNRDPNEMAQFESDRLLEIKTDAWAAYDEARQTAETELDRHAAAWRRKHDGDATRSLLELERARSRYSIASDDDLRHDATRYMSGDFERSPDALESLAAEASRRPELRQTAEALTKAMRAKCYNEPWRHAEGKEAARAAAVNDVPFGAISFDLDGETIQTVEIEELYKHD